MTNPYQPDYRIGDAERAQAMDDLGVHFSAGRLSFEEYDERLKQVTQAVTRSDISLLFDDLPAARSPKVNDPSDFLPTTRVPEAHFPDTYSGDEIDNAYSTGRNIRGGILGLTGVTAVTLTTLTGTGAWIMLVPAIFILLDVMKLGPESWHAPSRNKIDRQRMKQARLLQQQQVFAIETHNAQQRALARAERKRKQEEFNSIATELATDALKRFRGKNK
ncbi:Hypothetical protein Cp262_1877 [Corynebacterium pseudotuberculosis]|uniref:DUF1707 SHOCT-like domain-containing protein n=1 Tax=Corynebacterium pseudotuberculosis TaxID=1719 RepID=UPI00065E5F71|nr:DUF1707 domain-containing protein [Corynebacterium pseudotuberculosis]AKP09510.1 Hypothetical protein Cp262_1877 [Corynebacterium pseudotuberculosis]